MLETNIVVTPIVKSVSLDWNSILVVWGPTLLALVGGIVLYLKARTAEIMNKLTSQKVDDVAVKVDGQHTAMIAKIDSQSVKMEAAQKEILGLSKEKATLEEQKHGAEVASALKEQSK